MRSSINLSLTNELRNFINENSGGGTLYSTPSEFLRDILREKKQHLETSELRDSILEGLQDAVKDRTLEYSGDLRADMKKHRQTQ
ncbi:hypothetical protein [uncultured Cocleimonas sp.]|uniref:ribbon-helix-helix domain-containing protein n=1 Tax=uncultured Cocleimonas sp. TaxID=1051587 RepID=UPI0026209B0B|nr:hypothetical protein [uncultured Cocleimonas sp.]